MAVITCSPTFDGMREQLFLLLNCGKISKRDLFRSSPVTRGRTGFDGVVETGEAGRGSSSAS